jgi:UDP-4-amino-4,6-dideoxy-N-acetyl-beta-L-altrosamine transaminase
VAQRQTAQGDDGQSLKTVRALKTIPYGRQSLNAADIREVVKALRSDWLTQGPRVAEFERALCAYTGAKFAVAVSNGTAALHIACLAAGIGSGDEVITSPLTFAASANCALYVGARPVFSDVQPDTGNIDPHSIESRISRKTKALIPVHYSGHPCDMERIRSIARKRKLIVIEDAAHALGASYKGSKIGSGRYSDMTILSFHPVKHIATGEGGAVLTNDVHLHKTLMRFRTHGISAVDFMNEPHGAWYHEMQVLGYNYRITDIQCALGVSQLKRLDAFVAKRRQIAERYKAALDPKFFVFPQERSNVRSSYHLFPLRVRPMYAAKRAVFFSLLRKRGIGVQVHYIPVYRHPYYQKNVKSAVCPNAEAYYACEVSIPMFPALTDAQFNRVVKVVNATAAELFR